MNGFINLLKPPGLSSAAVVSLVKRTLPRGTRVGHMGTLDPAAAGVLPVAVGQANRLFDYVSGSGKTYLFEITLGVRTDTQDQTGKVVSVSDAIPDKEALLKALPAFVGHIKQRPSVYSALKQDGKPLYALARSGQEVVVPEREVDIYALDFVRQSGENRYLLRVACQGGTYVRSICDDLGNVLGCGAHVSLLLREKSGFFTLDEALTPDAFVSACQNNTLSLIPMDAPLAHMDTVYLSAKARKRVINGQAIPFALVSGYRNGQKRLSGEEDGQAEGYAQDMEDGLLSSWQGRRVCVYLEDRFAGIGEVGEKEITFKAMLLEKET